MVSLSLVSLCLCPWACLQVSKLMLAVQSAAYGSANNELTSNLVKTIVGLKVEEHSRKMEMVAGGLRSPNGAKAS